MRSTVVLGLGVLGLVPCSPNVAIESGDSLSRVSPSVNEPDVAMPYTTPFVGNPELKARLDFPGKLTVAGERVHDQLLRRFYTARGYETVWTSHPAEAGRLWNAVLLAGKQGLDPTLFHSTTLAERGTALSPVEQELLLSDAFLSYADALSRGAMPIEDRADDEDLTPEPVDIVAVLDEAIAGADQAKIIGALAPASTEYEAMRRAYAEYRAIAQGGGSLRGPGMVAR